MSDTEVTGLPRGIWYEQNKKRYRVRLYRNNIAYLAGYFADLNTALRKLAELKKMLASIPKRKRVIINEPYAPSLDNQLSALSSASALDPRTKRLKSR